MGWFDCETGETKSTVLFYDNAYDFDGGVWSLEVGNSPNSRRVVGFRIRQAERRERNGGDELGGTAEFGGEVEIGCGGMQPLYQNRSESTWTKIETRSRNASNHHLCYPRAVSTNSNVNNNKLQLQLHMQNANAPTASRCTCSTTLPGNAMLNNATTLPTLRYGFHLNPGCFQSKS